MGSLGEFSEKEMMVLSPSDPIVVELNRLDNHLRDKERELEQAYREIKAMKTSEALKDKALMELNNELQTQDEKLRHFESQLDQKNLEIQRLFNEKREALAAQFAAEATLRRIHASQEDEQFVPLDSIIAPLESDIKRFKSEIAMLREEKKALERTSKTKEAALIEAGNILTTALERALIVEEVQNKNIELRRQIEIFQEENKVLEKSSRGKVVEIERMSRRVRELEENLLAGGAIVNSVKDYQRQLAQLKEEKRTLERELARIKVFVNRVASISVQEWRDENTPVKKWLEERRFLQAEIQRLRNRMTISEKSAKTESQLNEKLRVRLKTLEDGLRNVSKLSVSNHNEKIIPENKSKSFTPNIMKRSNSVSSERSEKNGRKP
ncbi:hypothetical protein LUZ60_005609 [Juncus effusus]|nr:hypothetical protein LUZ60_005609 [Juncus effusus]